MYFMLIRLLEELFVMNFNSSCDAHHLLVVAGVLQRYKTDISNSTGWCINIISIIEIHFFLLFFYCEFKVKSVKPKTTAIKKSVCFFCIFFLQCVV